MPTAPNGRRFRFSLRTLFALMLIACVAGLGFRELRRRQHDEWERLQSQEAMKDAWLRNEREPSQPVPLR
jgi:hypothetical protein